MISTTPMLKKYSNNKKPPLGGFLLLFFYCLQSQFPQAFCAWLLQTAEAFA
jgi:hypothetical protein